MTPAISIALCRRPEYPLRCLSAIRCARVLEGCPITVVVDAVDGHHHLGVVKIADDFCRDTGAQLVLHKQKVGCNGNIRSALDHGFKKSRFTLVIEDDVVIANDAIYYTRWAAEKYESDPDIMTVGLWRHPRGWRPQTGLPMPEAEEQLVGRSQFFTCWGRGTWRDRWEQISERWTTGGDADKTSWDHSVSGTLFGRKEIMPKISRAINIGERDGTHRGAAWPGCWADGFVDPTHPVRFFEE